MTAENAPIRGHCPNCAGDRLCDIAARYFVKYQDDESPIWSHTDYRILQCRGCESVFFRKDFIFSEYMDYKENARGEEVPYFPAEITQWPAVSTRKRPDWHVELYSIDVDLHRLFGDIYTALDNDLGVLAAIGIRTVFDRASELLGVDPAETFAEKLTDLHTGGKIGLEEKGVLEKLADAGSAAAHRGWRPKEKELDAMMGIIESFLYRAFVIPDEAQKLVSVPPKPKRKTSP